MSEIKFEIVKEIGVIGEGSKGWTKVSWNDREPKYDIRDWDAAHEKMGKGMTLSNEEIKKLKDILNGIDL